MTVVQTMLESMSVINVQSQMFRVMLLAAVATAGALALVGAITGTSIATFLVFIPGMVYTPPTYFVADQVVSPVGGLLLDPQGLVKNYTVGVVETLNETTIVAGGEAFEVNVVGDLGTVRLKDRGLAPGPHARAQWTVTEEGITTAVTGSQPIDSADVLSGASTVDDALGAEFLLVQAEASLVNARVLEHESADMTTSVATPGVLSVGIVPSAVAGQNCSHPTQIDFGGGTRVDACASGVAPNTPGGRASLGTDLFVLPSQLPVVFRPDFMGLWNASANSPFLDNAACVPTDYYYYVVKGSGNTTLGAHGVWRSKDILVCQNGTWERIEDVSSGVSSIFGRTGAPTPQLGDYASDLIPVNNGTLEDVGLAPFVVYGPATTLPNAVLLQGVAGEVDASGAVLSLATIDFLDSLPSSVFAGSVRNAVVDRKGRLVYAEEGGAFVQTLNGTANQILATGTENVTLSLLQDIHTGANVQYGAVTVGSREMLASGGGIATIPLTTPADFWMTAGTQTINGATTWEAPLTVGSGFGLQLNNVGGTASTSLRTNSLMVTNTVVRYPPTLGNNNDALKTDGAGNTYWEAAPSASQWAFFSPITALIGPQISSITYYYGAYRWNGQDNSLVEVRMSFRIDRSAATSDTLLSFRTPVGFIANYAFNKNVGVFTRSNHVMHHGSLKMGNALNEIVARTEPFGTNELTEFWYVEYTYIVDI